MAGRARTCPTPHPIRGGYDTRGEWEWAATLEIVGRYADSSWLRCTACGAWFWVVCETADSAYRNEWRLPKDAAERALRGREPGPIVALLVEQGLPHGPLWEPAGTRVGLLRAMTPDHDDGERIAALLAQPGLGGEWSEALAQMIAEHAAARPSLRAPPLDFIVDLHRDMAGCEDVLELPGAVIVPLNDRLLRFNEQGGVEIPLPGSTRLLARQVDSLLFVIEGSTPSLRLLRSDTMLGLPLPDGVRPLALALDRGHYLMIFAPPATPGGPQQVELRNAKLEFVASLSVIVEPHMPHPTLPRAMTDGWLFANVVADAGETIGLCLFDEAWQLVARSEGSEGVRSCEVVDDQSVLAVPRGSVNRLEGWRREDARITRTFTLPCQTHVRLGERIVASESGEVFGCDLAGQSRWRRWIGSVDPLIALGSAGVLARGDQLLASIDPDTGESITQIEGPIGARALVDRSGTTHLMLGTRTLLSWSPAGKLERTSLDGDYELVASAGIGVVVRQIHDRTRHLWIAFTGEPIAEFEADDPRWTTVASAAGPHVLERERLRLHRLPAGG